MPAVRTEKRHLTMAESARTRARSRLKNMGLDLNLIDVDAVEAAVLEHNCPDIEMIDVHIDKLIDQGLKDSQWASESSKRTPTNIANASTPVKAATLVPTTTNSTEQTPTSRIILKPVLHPNAHIAKASIVKPSIPPAKITNIPTISTDKLVEPVKVNHCPLELRAVLEAEERRAAQTAANLKTCTTAINGIQDALSSQSESENKEFAESLLVYLRAAIAQYMATGQNVKPPILPLKPTTINSTIPIPKTQLTTSSARNTKTNVQVNSWAIIAQKATPCPTLLQKHH